MSDHAEGRSVELVADAKALAAAYTCDIADAVAQTVFQRTRYVLLTEVVPDRTDYRVAFAVDDGQSVHVGYRDASPCSGIAQEMAVVGTTFLLPKFDRPVVLHRCASQRPPCGAVP